MHTSIILLIILINTVVVIPKNFAYNIKKLRNEKLKNNSIQIKNESNTNNTEISFLSQDFNKSLNQVRNGMDNRSNKEKHKSKDFENSHPKQNHNWNNSIDRKQNKKHTNQNRNTTYSINKSRHNKNSTKHSIDKKNKHKYNSTKPDHKHKPNKNNDGKNEIEQDINEYQNRHDLQELLKVIVTSNFNTNDHKCLAIICDNYYKDVFKKRFLYTIGKTLSYYMIHVKETEDLMSPNYKTLKVIKQIHKEGCKIYIILIANGFQVARFLKFSDRYRMIDTRANYLLLYDTRVFHSELHYLWKRIVNVAFIRRYRYNKLKTKFHKISNKTSTWFELSTVPFPNPIRTILVPKRLDIWNSGKFNSNTSLFADKTMNLNGQSLRVIVLQHIPAVVKILSNQKINSTENDNSAIFAMNVTSVYTGVEVEALKVLGKAMNFNPILYETENSIEKQWGRKQSDGSFDGLLGEITSGKADIALGDLHYTPYHLDLIDLSIPYNTECLTFLTPEALTDNSWQTLILPFKLYMWIGVIIGLCLGGFIFYALARFQYFLTEKKSKTNTTEIVPWVSSKPNYSVQVYNKSSIPDNYFPVVPSFSPDQKSEGLYLFGDLFNSFLYTYSMLLVVSLPKLPTGWSLRMLTGWYWLYCILIVVSYRASMTAILANPAPRVTIDTLQQLADSNVRCGGWGEEILDFFQTSLDTNGQKIGQKFENVDDPDRAVTRIAKGEFAYYENQYYLKAISVKRQVKLQHEHEQNNSSFEEINHDDVNSTSIYKVKNERNLHIMMDCVINMPISIGLQKNSPLKPRADKFLRQVIEAGLIEKWLTDVMAPTLNAEIQQNDKTKALMSLKKLYGALVTLAIGYGISILILIGELVHWNFYVKKKPYFDKYYIKKYYEYLNQNPLPEIESIENKAMQ